MPGPFTHLRGDYSVLGFGCFPAVGFLIDQIEIPKVWQRKLLIALDGPIFGLATQGYNGAGAGALFKIALRQITQSGCLSDQTSPDSHKSWGQRGPGNTPDLYQNDVQILSQTKCPSKQI